MRLNQDSDDSAEMRSAAKVRLKQYEPFVSVAMEQFLKLLPSDIKVTITLRISVDEKTSAAVLQTNDNLDRFADSIAFLRQRVKT